MPRLSVLEMVQDILSDMNSDPVNSINDTLESGQVARILRSTFYNIQNDRVWPHLAKLIQLESVADPARPTHMRMSEDVQDIEWVKYNVSDDPDNPLQFREMKYMLPKEFTQYVMTRNATSSNVQTVIDYHGSPLLVLDDRMPTYFTTFDDKFLVFDSYDKDVDSVLQASKTQVYAHGEPEFLLQDDFVPDIPSKVFPYLLAEAKSTASLKVKEQFSQKDEQNSARQKGWLSRKKHRAEGGIRYPNYGRI